MGLSQWFSRVAAEGHDSYGAFEWPLGLAILLGFGLCALVGVGLWVWFFLWFLIFLALYYGHRLERQSLRMLGLRRRRGTLTLRITWLLLTWVLFWAEALLLFARARGWALDSMSIPLFLPLIIGGYYLSLGIKARVKRWLVLGGMLVLWVGVAPGFSWFARYPYFLSGTVAGGMLLLSGWLGRRAFRRQALSRGQLV